VGGKSLDDDDNSNHDEAVDTSLPAACLLAVSLAIDFLVYILSSMSCHVAVVVS